MMDTMRPSALTLSALPLLVASCTGLIGESMEDPGTGAGSGANGGSGGTTGSPTGPESAGPLALRRLSRREYNNTIYDLVGVRDALSASFPRDSANEGGFVSPDLVSGQHARIFWETAAQIAKNATPSLTASCDLGKLGEEACARRLIVSFGRRAFRRPLEEDEIHDLQELFKTARLSVEYAYPDSLALVIETMLQSPNFLYHWEAGAAKPVYEGALIKLSDHQMASRLSYLLWGTMPDPALFAAADAGQLDTREGVARQVDRMVRDKHFAETAVDFHRQWLMPGNLADLVKDSQLFSAAVGHSVDAELAAFTSYVLKDSDARLRTLLTAPYSFVDQSLAKIYGITGATAALAKKDLKPMERAGILTQTAFLAAKATANRSSPTGRGKFVFEKLLCGTVPPPPEDMDTKLKPAGPNVSTRERMEMHGQKACASCHRVMDPLGFAFEHYGAVGEYRSQDGGKPVDSSGMATIPGGGVVTFGSAIDLVDALSGSEDVRRCIARSWFRYAIGRLESDGDKPSFEIAAQRFHNTDGDLRDLLLAISQTKAFRYRLPTDGEVR